MQEVLCVNRAWLLLLRDHEGRKLGDANRFRDPRRSLHLNVRLLGAIPKNNGTVGTLAKILTTKLFSKREKWDRDAAAVAQKL